MPSKHLRKVGPDLSTEFDVHFCNRGGRTCCLGVPARQKWMAVKCAWETDVGKNTSRIHRVWKKLLVFHWTSNLGEGLGPLGYPSHFKDKLVENPTQRAHKPERFF